jgi:hypothetical protein
LNASDQWEAKLRLENQDLKSKLFFIETKGLEVTKAQRGSNPKVDRRKRDAAIAGRINPKPAKRCNI